MRKRNVGIYLFNEVEVLDFAGPFEVFAITAELNKFELFNVFTFAEKPDTIKAVNGLQVVPDYYFENCPPLDILCLPGGNGTKREIEKPNVLDWLNNRQAKAEICFTVCSGARIIAKLGLLDGLKVTTHHEVLSDLEKLAPLAKIDPNARFTDNGEILTSGGISAGIDLSLYLVEKLHGTEIVQKTRSYMEYGDWKKGE